MDNCISEEKNYEIVNANKNFCSVRDLGEGMELVGHRSMYKHVIGYPKVILNHKKKTAFVLNNEVKDFESLETLKDSTSTMEPFGWLPRNNFDSLVLYISALIYSPHWVIGKYQNEVAQVEWFAPHFPKLFWGFIDKEGSFVVKSSKHINDVNEIQSMRKKAEEIVAKRNR